ncbi:DUF1917-domain-containing protein [Aaosphaeria arxii CBS 175.79]|uniref:DUF1917-domain-containing protein n=1 Tax=Aaosphaeria arxii CBS 175.79 TaxID=1450172 RepID=A0A6A5XGS2_9PLEO|nr:DUF1917-domain-containing protein [Aaosphaeria arxii CBS 175.79]KAF2012037.1 DUF1917-domain-containing protein [Aaosphaeria arxii CBS 175.79]
MESEGMVSGEGWISDDSSFYGDEEEQDRWTSLCNGHTTMNTAAHDLNIILARARAKPAPDLHNIYEGRMDSWQLHESIDDFLERLPPGQTTVSICPWIWVANPHPSGRDRSGRSHAQDQLVPRGKLFLQQALQERDDIISENSRSAKGTVTRLLDQNGAHLKQKITDLAIDTNVLSGKWMLFRNAKSLESTWRKVAEATINNRLGTAAKVATDDGKGGDRLICVYTKDFRDAGDILRVVKEIAALGLLDGGRGIFYKSDAYTYLDIYGSNAPAYGLQASLFSSKKLLSSANYNN